MACKYATPTDQYHGWECNVTGDSCVMLPPSEKACPYLDFDEIEDKEANHEE